MSLALRRRHLAAFSVLAVLVPAGLILSVVERDPVPPPVALPEDLAPTQLPADVAEGLSWSREGALWERLGIELALVPNPGGLPRVAFRPTRALPAPKVLVYWAPGPATAPLKTIPKGAQLLGALAGSATDVFPLPALMHDVQGRFVVYSLGHREVLAETPTRPPASRS